MQQLSDEELIQRSRAAQLGAQDPYINELLSRYRQRVALWCLRYTGDREEALDLAQDALTQAWRRLESFEGMSRFSTWLYTITRNTCLNSLRSRDARGGEPAELPEELPDLRISPLDDELARAAQLEMARRWVTEILDQTEQRVFAMHFGDEIPLEAVTRLLGLSNASGAKAYVVSGRRKLAEAARRWRARCDRPAAFAAAQ